MTVADAHSARVELNEMCDALKRDAPQFFRMGEFKCRRKLSNGAVVSIRIKMPAQSEGDPK